MQNNNIYSNIDDELFGSEFIKELKNPASSKKTAKKKVLSYEERYKVMEGYNNVRKSVLADSLFIGLIGFNFIWLVGTYKDAYSFGIGAILGSAYTILLGKYVEKIGTANTSKTSDSLRFVPAILLIVLYAKFKTLISIIPELTGFFTSYQLASLLQAFNQNLYGYDLNDNNNEEN